MSSIILSEHDRIQHTAALEFLDLIPMGNFETIADLGSGPGHQAKFFYEKGKTVTCIDFLQPKYPELNHLKADLTNIPASDATFDAAWSHHCLEHIHNPIGALIEWNRILRADGWLFLTVPQIGMSVSSGHINNYNIPLLIYHLSIAGFSCKSGYFTKNRSHLRAAVRKSALYNPTSKNYETSLKKLAEYEMFHDSVKRSINETGRFSCDGMILTWLDGKKIYARRNTNMVSEWIDSVVWDYSR